MNNKLAFISFWIAVISGFYLDSNYPVWACIVYISANSTLIYLVLKEGKRNENQNISNLL
jgi:hypothetical protein